MKHNAKTLLLAIAALAMVAVSCRKENVGANVLPRLPEGDNVTLSLSANTGVSKAVGLSEDENGTERVSSLQAFIFRKDEGHEGELAAYVRSESASTVNVVLTSDEEGIEYDFWVIANNYDRIAKAWKYDIDAKTTRKELEETITDLKDNFYISDGGNLVMDLLMAGSKSVLIEKTTKSIVVDVARLVSKIELREIEVNYNDNLELMRHDLRLESVFVTNAVKNLSIGAVPPSEWTYYNEGGYISGPCDPILYDEAASEILNDGTTMLPAEYKVNHKFFTYTNHSGKSTKLVLKCLYGEAPSQQTWYYPIDLGELESGKAYIITKAKIAGPGNPDPEKPIHRAIFDVSVKVVDWGLGFEKEVVI